MRKSVFALLFVATVAGLVLWMLSNPSGLSLGGVGFGGSDRGFLSQASLEFLEDLRYKDFDRASEFHLAEAKKKRNIPELIRKKFHIKHEILDVRDYEILSVDFNSRRDRARVRAFVEYRVLGDQRVREHKEASRDLEMLLYWFKKGDTWFMELESSL